MPWMQDALRNGTVTWCTLRHFSRRRAVPDAGIRCAAGRACHRRSLSSYAGPSDRAPGYRRSASPTAATSPSSEMRADARYLAEDALLQRRDHRRRRALGPAPPQEHPPSAGHRTGEDIGLPARWRASCGTAPATSSSTPSSSLPALQISASERLMLHAAAAHRNSGSEKLHLSRAAGEAGRWPTSPPGTWPTSGSCTPSIPASRRCATSGSPSAAIRRNCSWKCPAWAARSAPSRSIPIRARLPLYDHEQPSEVLRRARPPHPRAPGNHRPHQLRHDSAHQGR